MNALRNIVVESKNSELYNLVKSTHTVSEIENGLTPIFDSICTSPTHYIDFVFNDINGLDWRKFKIVSIYYDENSISVELSKIIKKYNKYTIFGSHWLSFDLGGRYPYNDPSGFEELKQNIYDLIEIHNALDLREYRIVSMVSYKI